MSMTASELFEVVKDVTREAWGNLDWYCGEFVKKHTYDVVDSDVAEHAFVGSMTALLANNLKMPELNACISMFSVRLVNGQTYREVSLVAALAAACKEAA